MNESVFELLLQGRRAMRKGHAHIERLRQQRLAELVAFARGHSKYYKERYATLPELVHDPAVLPVVRKQELMARFDDWPTDRAVTRAEVHAVVEDPKRIGELLLGRYLVATTSGTTGFRGIFLIDDRALRVTNVLALRMLRAWLSPFDFLRIAARGARATMVMATGGHYASAVAAARLKQGSPRRAKRLQALSVQAPMHELVRELNGFQPAIVAPYASMAPLLADEQEAGRLNVHPVLMALAAEGLPDGEYRRIATVFGSRVGNSYSATECPFLSYSCEAGWLHVNSDWVILEPVDANYMATPAGEPSHTVLITNLANRVQPILRYDLGDSVLARPGPCTCGNPLPAIRFAGRSADALVFTTSNGDRVSLPPLAFDLDEVPGVELVQIVHAEPAMLRVRMRLASGTSREQVWSAMQTSIRRLLIQRDLAHVLVALSDEPPQPSAGGKFRAVVPLTATV